MLFMQFKIGPDMAICLIKAILFSMLSVFVVMPGLLMLFGPYMSKTKHRNFVPKISFVGRYAYKPARSFPSSLQWCWCLPTISRHSAPTPMATARSRRQC